MNEESKKHLTCPECGETFWKLKFEGLCPYCEAEIKSGHWYRTGKMPEEKNK